jgi:hypothetical protein
VNGDHGPLRWSLLLYHLWHRLWRHLRLPLRLYHILRDSFGGLGLTVRSRLDSHIYDSRAHYDGRVRGRGPGQKG